jgi:hypothetical protein
MPRCLFHVYRDGERASTDAEGVEPAGDDAACAEASGACGRAIGDLDGAGVERGLAHGGGDVRGTTLFRLSFRAGRTGG